MIFLFFEILQKKVLKKKVKDSIGDKTPNIATEFKIKKRKLSKKRKIRESYTDELVQNKVYEEKKTLKLRCVFFFTKNKKVTELIKLLMKYFKLIKKLILKKAK